MTNRACLVAISLVWAVVAGAAACEKASGRPETYSHPADLVGRWVRLREDSTWGDTLEYLADGRVHGSTGHAVPSSARWGVKGEGRLAQFCAGDSTAAYCQTYQLAGDQLQLAGGPFGPTYFRRVRD